MKKQTLVEKTEYIGRIGSWEWEIESDRWTCTDGWRRLYGVDAHAAMSLSALLAMVVESDRDAVDHAIHTAIASRTTIDFEHRLIDRVDGNIRYIRVQGEFSCDALDQPATLFGIAQDVTEHKLAQDALRREETKYRVLFENMIEGFSLQEVITDDTGQTVDFVFLETNQAYDKHTGMDGRASIGKSMLEIAPHADRRQIALYGKVAMTGEPETFEYFSKTFGKHLRVRAFCVERGRFATIFEDITERKLAEDALRIQRDVSQALSESDDIHQALNIILHAAMQLENIDCGGIYLVDNTGSLHLAASLGLSPEFVSNLSHLASGSNQVKIVQERHIHYRDRASIMAQPNSMYEREGIRSLVVVPVIEQNHIVAVINLASHTRDAIPEHTRTTLETLSSQIGSALARLRADAALRTSQQNLRTLFDTVDDFFFVLDESGHILQVNAAVVDRLGYAMEDLVGEEVLIVHPPDRRAEAAAVVAGILTQTTDTCSLPLQTKWGALIPVETHMVWGEWNGLPAIFGVSRDITDRMRMEAALRSSEELFRTIAQLVPAGIFTTDKNGRCTYANDKWLEMGGLPLEDVLGDGWINAIHPVDRELMPQRWLEMVDARKEIRAEFRFQTPTGVTTWVHGKVATLFDDRGEVTGYIGAEMDITERHHMEEELRLLNEQLELRVAERTIQLERAVIELKQADQMKDSFLASVSHELRTPLTGVLGMADALELQVTGPLEEHQLRYVQHIRQSGERLLKMVNSILHYTALLAGKASYQPELCHLVELCAISLRGVRELAERKKLRLQFDISPEDLQITSDANGILQTLDNLLDNAVKFTPDGGRIGLDVALDPSGNAVNMTVWDTGIGIAPEHQETIFKPFEQVDHGLDRQFEGVGLGLAYAGQMVRILGGSISVQSALGAGSRFTMTLPVQPIALD